MSMDMTQIAGPTLSQLPSGWLIAANEVLALSSADLQLFIREEQMSNPALEVEERPVCPGCGRTLHDQHCPYCQSYTSLAESGTADPALLDEGTLWPAGTSNGSAEEWVDPLTFVPAQSDWKEQLQLQVRLQLPAQDAPLIEYLVGSLDEDGYLGGTVEEAAQLFAVPRPRVQAVLEALQAQKPAGIGARTVRECLVLQLERLEVDDALQTIVAQIITKTAPGCPRASAGGGMARSN